MKKFGEIFRVPSYAKVEFHPYRTANPKMILMSINRDSEAGKELEDMLLEKAREDSDNPERIHKDNHICYSFGSYFGSTSDESKMVVKVSDRDISIGIGLVRERW